LTNSTLYLSILFLMPLLLPLLLQLLLPMLLPLLLLHDLCAGASGLAGSPAMT
jgi:hypothetical protein